MRKNRGQYYEFTNKSRLDKAINSLVGLVQGIVIDHQINSAEVMFLREWLAEHQEYQDDHPFNELMPVVRVAIEDNVLTQEEQDDILWLSEKIRSCEYYDAATADMQHLHGIVGGITADHLITEDELAGLSAWLQDHEHLRFCWPYDEIDSLVTVVLADKKISSDEHETLQQFFGQFVALGDTQSRGVRSIVKSQSLSGICAVNPQVTFSDALFCFSGESKTHTREQLTSYVTDLGGRVIDHISHSLDYLVIGAGGNPCWAYACYGRKVEKAMALRQEGHRILLIHEFDFHDAVADVQ